MKRRYDFPYKELLYSVIGWLFLMYFYYLVSFYGFINSMEKGLVYDYITSWKPHIELSLSGILFGLLFGLINITVERSVLRRKSFGFLVIIKSSLYVAALLIVSAVVDIVFIYFGLISAKTKMELFNFFTNGFFVSFTLFFITALALSNIFVQVSKKFGPGNFTKLILGRYHTPKEEEKIFMFLDLKGSTGIAEKLGHTLYSQFLRNCYHELTEFIIKYHAHVYQYVGDEVVLCWDVGKGIEDLNCFKLFFAFREKLRLNKSQYLELFKVIPVFKCGLDMGTVTVSEIGDLKREIAFHGDVLNTASRIQEQCNNYHKDMLISQHLANEIEPTEILSKTFIAKLNLRGKRNDVAIFSIELNNNNIKTLTY